MDRSVIGQKTEPVTYEVEKGHIRHFAEAIGDCDPVHHDEDAAREAGHPTIIAPPTFVTALRPKDPREPLAIDFRKLLHGEQTYRYERPVYAGDVLEVTAWVADIYEKAGRSGPMDFVVVETEARERNGELVYSSRSVAVVRR